MFVLYRAFIYNAKYLLLFFTKLYEPALKKTLESARMNNSAGFSCQVFGFALMANSSSFVLNWQLEETAEVLDSTCERHLAG